MRTRSLQESRSARLRHRRLRRRVGVQDANEPYRYVHLGAHAIRGRHLWGGRTGFGQRNGDRDTDRQDPPNRVSHRSQESVRRVLYVDARCGLHKRKIGKWSTRAVHSKGATTSASCHGESRYTEGLSILRSADFPYAVGFRQWLPLARIRFLYTHSNEKIRTIAFRIVQDIVEVVFVNLGAPQIRRNPQTANGAQIIAAILESTKVSCVIRLNRGTEPIDTPRRGSTGSDVGLGDYM